MNDLREDFAADDDRSPSSAPRHGFAYRVAVVYGIGVLFVLAIAFVWIAADVLLLIFASVLVAVLLNAASRAIRARLDIGPNIALALVLVLLATLFGLIGYFAAPPIARQVGELAGTLPQAMDTLHQYLQQHPLGRELLRLLPDPRQALAYASELLIRADVVFSGAIGAIFNFMIILFVGIYLAAQPRLYINGFLKLVPKRKRQRGKEVFAELGRTLELWLLGKLASMLVIGTASAIGLLLLDIPLAITLGVIAGLFDFIPYLGPILAGVPAVLVAFAESPASALYVVLLFIGIQAAEGYLLLPLVERQTVALPPAVTISMQVMLGLPFGLMGVAMATPLTAVLFVLITMLYVQDMLDDPVRKPSEM